MYFLAYFVVCLCLMLFKVLILDIAFVFTLCMMLLLCSNFSYYLAFVLHSQMEHFTMQSPDFHSLKHSQFTYAIVVDLGMEKCSLSS